MLASAVDKLTSQSPLADALEVYSQTLLSGENFPDVFYSMAFNLPKEAEWNKDKAIILQDLYQTTHLLNSFRATQEITTPPKDWKQFIEDHRQWVIFLAERGGSEHYEVTVWKFQSHDAPVSWLLVRNKREPFQWRRLEVPTP